MQGDSVLTKGSLEDVFIGEVICLFSREHETGILEVSSQRKKKRLFFQDGRIVFAESNDPDERLGLYLLRRNKVAYRDLVECAERVRPNQRIGAVLVLEGYLQPDDLYQGVVGQIKEIILSLFEWTAGEYEFQSGPLASKEVITLNLSTPDLLIAGINRVWRWSTIWEGIGSLDSVLRKHQAWSIAARNMTATPETRMLLDLFDRPRTLEEILQLSSLGDFETCRLVRVFLLLGIVEEILVAPKWESLSLEAESVPERAESTAEIPAPSRETVLSTDPDQEQTVDSGESTEKIRMVVPEESEVAEPKQEEVAEPQRTEAAVPQPTGKEILEEENHAFDELEAEWDTQSMPLIKSEDLNRFRQERHFAEDTEKLTILHHPSTELSFADLAELTDAVKNEERQERVEPAAVVEIRKEDILPELSRFNELHRYLFEMVQLELGNKVSEFLSRAFIKASTRYPLVFEGVRVNEYGELSERSVLTNVELNLVQNLPEALKFLLREERTLIRSFLDPHRADLIEAGLESAKKEINQEGR